MLSWNSSSDPYFVHPAFGGFPAWSPARPWSGGTVPGGPARPGRACTLCGHDAAGADEPDPGSATFLLGPRRPAPPVTSWITGQGACPVPPPGEGLAQPAGFDSSPFVSPAVPWCGSDQPFATPVAAWSGHNMPGSLTWLGQVCPLCGHDASRETGDDAAKSGNETDSETEPGTGAGPGR